MTVPTRPADVGRLARAVTAAGLGGLGLLVAAPASHAVTVPPGVYVVDEALKLMFGITVVAVLALGVTVVALVPHFDVANLFDIVPNDAA
ncbi:hypothetical protein D8M29_08955, partial [Micrococcus sp. HSID17227]